jgi:hypothetical protein
MRRGHRHAETPGHVRLKRVTLPRTVRLLLAVVAAALAITAVWLALDNPVIHNTSRADNYSCLAPWDTVLNDADNIPGGEPAPDGEEIGARCRDAGHDRFDLAVASGSAAMVLGLLTAVVTWRGSRARVTPSS